MMDSEAENEPLLVGDGGIQKENEDTNTRIQPKRTIIVEPLVVQYALPGMPIASLKCQYMYQKIASDMGIDLDNLTGKYSLILDFLKQ